MTKSSRAKKEKAKDFQKPKLKVGKAKPKASNATDTSFKARSISILHQSLSTTAPNLPSQMTHHLALLSHKSDKQRQESLSHLTSLANSSPTLPLPASDILRKIAPLILDGSGAVRNQLIKLLQALPKDVVGDNISQLTLYLHAALTHLAATIRSSGIDMLEALLQIAGSRAVACPGGWLRTLKFVLMLLGWPLSGGTSDGSKAASVLAKSQGSRQNAKSATSGWTSVGATFTIRAMDKNDAFDKQQARQIQVLTRLVQAGLAPKPADELASYMAFDRDMWPVTGWRTTRIQPFADPYAHLRLYEDPARPADAEMLVFAENEDRWAVWKRDVEQAVVAGIAKVKSEGGTVGRAVAGLQRTMKEVRDSRDAAVSQ